MHPSLPSNSASLRLSFSLMSPERAASTADDPEKRLQKVMDKLYHAPKRRPSLPSGSSGKRPESGQKGSFEKGTMVATVAAASVGKIGEAPPCRPWDRGDLFRRLATFKAMTWFGKPKVISPVNCARRGWVNLEMDVIACEACGARLLFSTPSSWSMLQVEKAAAVFSLKLDNGHKLLCPWIDNACDEPLALFPRTPPQTLVESYCEHSFALLKFSALPVISSSAIDYMKMKSSLLENFLSDPSHYPINLPNGFKIVEGSICNEVDGGFGNGAADSFYQVLKIICLCGWEPRLLPYAVDYQEQSNPSIEHPTASNSSQLHHEQKDDLTIYSSGIGEIESKESVNPDLASDTAYDPASAVLDCKFCGACVALWAFATVQRPLEHYTLVTDSSSKHERTASGVLISQAEALQTVYLGMGTSDTSKGDFDTHHVGPALKEKSIGLNLTIAGGPPPTKQNFQPRVSFPIVSRHLRTELISSRNLVSLEDSSRKQVDCECLPTEDDVSQSQNDIIGALVMSHGPDMLKHKRSENESMYGGSDDNALSNSIGEIDGANTNGQVCVSTDEGTVQHEGHQYGNIENHEGHTQTVSKVSDKEDVELGKVSYEQEDDLGETTNTAALTQKDLDCSETPPVTEAYSCSKSKSNISLSEPLHDGGLSKKSAESTQFASTIDSVSTSPCANTEKGIKDISVKTMINDQASNRLEKMMPSSTNNGDENILGKRSMQMLYNRNSQFDPIRQHRSYCPWVAPDDGEAMSGWKLTLSAIVHQKKDSSPAASSLNEIPSTLLDDVDDPIISVRKLFTSPASKRLKGNSLISKKHDREHMD